LRLRRPVDQDGLTAAAVGAEIVGVRRLGKYLVIDLAGRDRAILVHLGMSGRLRLTPRGAAPAPHTHVVFNLAGPDQLCFSDPRRFGIVDLAPAGAAIRNHPALARLGPDPLEDVLDPDRFHAAMGRSRQPVKALLLDQRIVAGVGNISASEALWRSRIAPRRRGTGLSRSDAGVLLRAVVAALEAAL